MSDEQVWMGMVGPPWLDPIRAEEVRREELRDELAARREDEQRQAMAEEREARARQALMLAGRDPDGRTPGEILAAAAASDEVRPPVRREVRDGVDTERLPSRPTPAPVEPPEVGKARQDRGRREREALARELKDRGAGVAAGFVARPNTGTTGRGRA